MRKFLKIIGWTLLTFLILGFGIGIYFYQTDPMIKAMVKNDESKLYYFPLKEMGDMDELVYSENILPVDDSIKIHTYQFKPATGPKGNIFLIHGAGGNVSTYKSLIKPLVDNGFEVYALDWRGYGKSTGVPNYKGVMKDTEVAFKDFLKRNAADSLKTIVYGMSLGGPMAIKITKDNQTKVNALVLDGTVESAQSLAMDYAPADFLRNKIKQTPERFNQDYVGVRDIAEIKNIPKLIIHSRKDRDVPFKRGKNVFEAAKEPKEFWETETEHIMTLKELSDDAIKKINTLIQ
ncbi:alpha/beta hydrolase [Maribacter arenosus]|uniref:Alpha/beta fold hydrolase n=1 Tax=Maribacter arenosus TaxID=1854708 RepID=A0ABR7VHM0_9FLAO|nr:alpha/beta fold hydrolase [Maribacter arenosus]MBD0851908.1 alpha/beta fold hydrolase [Maribacter arenosus]